MTNKTICHGNNVNNKSHTKNSSHSLLLSATKAAISATSAPTSSTQSSSSCSSLSNGKSNNTSNTSQINNNNNNASSNNIKLCVGGFAKDNNGDGGGGGGGGGGSHLIKAYAHGIWYQEYDTIDNSVQQHIQLIQQQRQRFYNSNNVRTTISSCTKDANGNMLHTDNQDMDKCKQQHKSSIKDNNDSNKDLTNCPNNCDIVVVDIEDDELYERSTPPAPPTNRSSTLQYPINANIRNDRHTALLLERSKPNKHQERSSSNEHVITGRCVNVPSDGRDDDDGEGDDDDDSLASMETLSDNVSIWIDGEKHWIAGVDAQTTCADLIWALLNYQNEQPEHTLNANATQSASAGGIAGGQVNGNNTGSQCTEQSKEQQELSYRWTNNKDMKSQTNSNKVSGNTSNSSHTSNTTTSTTGNINQSMPNNTKEEHFKITENLSRNIPPLPVPPPPTMTTQTGTGCNATSGLLPCAPVTTFQLPPGITTAAQLTTEYVIVKQYHHCEEYLDGSTKVFDVLPPRNSQHKKECELLLRRLGPPPMSVYANNTTTTTTPQLSSLISTDKDSGMGSPVGSARSAKFRRRKHKSSQWLAQANTLHPKVSRCTTTANERLLKIILAQDETIQRQLSLLREKERQINKIEEEKHRKRERELGKNYLLETYLNGLDEADCELEQQDGEEIFIDEPVATADSRTTTTTSNNILMMPSQKDTSDMEMLMLDNFRPKDVFKKDKKKKRQKEISTTRDETNINKTTRDKDKEKLLRLYGNEMSNLPGSIVNDNETNGDEDTGKANKAEMEMQIFWWEKVYTLNKHLQKEEELAAKLHAKIRKHQLKKANQTQKEVQLEIDKLDNGLALQCGNIRRVEANLMETNDQLQKKLMILERLSLDYLRQQDREQAEESKQNLANEQCTTLNQPLMMRMLPQSLPTKSSDDMHKLSLNNIKSADEVEKLQKLIAKPGFEEQCRDTKERISDPTACLNLNDDADPLTAQLALPHHIGESRKINPAVVVTNERLLIANSTKGQTNCTTQRIGHLLKDTHDKQQSVVALRATPMPPPPPPTIQSTTSSSAALSAGSSTTKTMSQMSVLLDKNMLSSLHVQNAKTIKKQMFHAQTTTSPAGAATSIPPYPPPTAAPSAITITSTASANANSPKATEINAFPLKQQQQSQNFNQHMELPLSVPAPLPLQLTMSSSTALPTTTTTPPALITSRLTHSHHQPPPPCPILVTTRQPAGCVVAPIASLAPIQATMAMALPASSSSSPSSLMAMNTVDISQLGTLV